MVRARVRVSRQSRGLRGEAACGAAASCRGKAVRGEAAYNLVSIKTESTYQLRPRCHNRLLILKANATNECDFIVRMLYKDIIIAISLNYFAYLYHC